MARVEGSTVIDESLFFTWPTAFGALLGYALHVVLSWGEWRKLGADRALGFGAFLLGDPPAQISGVLSVLITYFSLPALGQLDWVQNLIGFELKLNFLSAVAVAFVSQAVAVKLRNISRKINGDG
jgi:hypothetical protein